MRHASDGLLRRLHDEPFAVPDATFDHVARCRRCSARRERFAAGAALAAGLLSGPQPVPDVDRAWEELAGRLGGGRGVRPTVPGPDRHRRALRVSGRTAAVAGVLAAAMAGTAAAASYSTIFAPTRVAPVPFSGSDLKAITGLVDLGAGAGDGGFPAASGTRSLPFGTLTWSSVTQGRQLASLAGAEAAAGFPAALPARLPGGVGPADRFVVQPRVSASVSFTSAAGRLAGTVVTFTAGPGLLVGYGSSPGGASVPTLGILTMPRPVAVSSGASLPQIEAFLLSRPGIPPELAAEVRLLGDVSTVLPVPAPAGVSSKAVRVGKWPGVALSAGSDAASGVIWEDGAGTVHLVAGLIDGKEALGVADQIH